MTNRAPFPYEPQDGSSGARTGPDGGPGERGQDGRGPRRSRARSFLPLAVVVWVVLEIWLLTLLADAAGGVTVLLVLVAGFVIGSAVIKRAGRRAWRNLAETLQKAQNAEDATRRGETPDPDADAAGRGKGSGMAMLGGLLIMIPGLVSDALGLLCLFPPTAKLMKRSTKGWLERRASRGGFAAGSLGDAYQQARGAEEQIRMHRPDGKVVQGEVVRDDDPPPRA